MTSHHVTSWLGDIDVSSNHEAEDRWLVHAPQAPQELETDTVLFLVALAGHIIERG